MKRDFGIKLADKPEEATPGLDLASLGLGGLGGLGLAGLGAIPGLVPGLGMPGMGIPGLDPTQLAALAQQQLLPQLAMTQGLSGLMPMGLPNPLDPLAAAVVDPTQAAGLVDPNQAAEYAQTAPAGV